MKKNLQLPGFFSDGMVLQRNKDLIIWGQDLPLSSIQIIFKNKKYQTRSNSKGDWKINLGLHAEGGPYQLSIQGSDSLIIDDIFLGEVWLAGGQSNMELPINRVFDWLKTDLESANYPMIRQFKVPEKYSFKKPIENIKKGNWLPATQEHIQDFSALAFFYAQNLYEKLGLAVGIYHVAVGGSHIEAWMSEATLKEMGRWDQEIEQLKDDQFLNNQLHKNELQTQQWFEKNNQKDKGSNKTIPWFLEEIDSSWKKIKLPQSFIHNELKGISGTIWFKKEFYLSQEMITHPNLILELGTLIDSDDTYVNGIHVGRTDYRYPPRKYALDKNILKVGKNIITVRLEITGENGAFIPDKFYGIKGEKLSIPFSDDWHYKIGGKIEPMKPQLFLHSKATGLYNSMIYPLRNLSIRGVIFYQGESNTHNPSLYGDLFKNMILDWRELWGEELPFYYVQLSNYIDPLASIDDRQWAELREQQYLVSQQLKKTGMISAIDVGLDNELHPFDKKSLGHRLSYWALSELYNKEYPHEHPQLEQLIENEKNFTIQFSSILGELTKKTNNGLPIEFIDDKGKIHLAQGEFIKNKLIIDKINKLNVKGIQYAWKNAPENLLIDKATSSPVLPFRYFL